MSALQSGWAALRRRLKGARHEVPAPPEAEAEVLRGVGLARSEHVSYEVGASGRVKAVRHLATPDPSELQARAPRRR
ncbi:hypothetical protein [Variovorax sp. KK3]|uniref:hypothetical protein n=1 Tax=Variovorax sp. KK3 TaxID=1855728 RepID=UPI00097CAC42|nr:hypothetical protein [Variovorax sp. KK3]